MFSPLFSALSVPLCYERFRIVYDRGDQPENDTLNRVLAFPSLKAVAQIVIERPNNDFNSFGTLFVSGLLNAHLEMNQLTILMNEAQARRSDVVGEFSNDVIIGLSFRNFTNSTPNLAQLRTVSIANNYPFDTCSDNERETFSAFGLLLDEISCNTECLSFPSLQKVSVLTDSRFNLAIYMARSNYPAVRFNALTELDMKHGPCALVLMLVHESRMCMCGRIGFTLFHLIQ